MSKQLPLTLVTPVLDSRKERLLEDLKEIRVNLQKGIQESFENIGTIHFARWLIIDIEPGQKAKLVFSSNFDGEIQQQIKDLSSTAGDIIDKIYECCEGYPSPGERTPQTRADYLNKWYIPPSAFYRGAPGRSLKQIKDEDRLHSFILNFVNSKKLDNYSASEVKKQVQEAVFSNPDFEWVKTPIKLPRVNWIGLFFIGIILLVLSPIIIIWALIVQFGYERHDEYFTLKRSQLDEKKIKTLEDYEDLEIPNQFSQLVNMKPGKVRLITFEAFMLFAKVLIPVKFVKGKLMGIPTIHFARWVKFDNNKRVLFFSNFDGSWQQYLGDFIDQSGWGLTGIFSNTTRFPKTKFLVTGGAYDEEHFLAWSRHSELQTQIWYNAYPHLSIKNVNNNSRIRYELLKKSSDKKAGEFLKLI
jgi:hypothetical protein